MQVMCRAAFGHARQLPGQEQLQHASTTHLLAPELVPCHLYFSALQLHELFDDVGDETPPPPGQDVSAEQWLRSKGATPLQLEVADVCYANDFGCSLQQLGLREMITENQR
jgi:hypothetical protein